MRMVKARLWMGLAMAVVMACSIGCTQIRPPNRTPDQDRVLLTTGYCRCGKCCGWKRNWLFQPVYASGPMAGRAKKVGVTSTGAWARPGTIAADPNVFPYGTVMYVPGYGYGRVEDTGSALKGGHIDLFFWNHGTAMDWGRQRKSVKIWLPR